MAKEKKPRRRLTLILWTVAAIAIYALAVDRTGVSLEEITSESRQEQLVRIIRALAHPKLVTYDFDQGVREAYGAGIRSTQFRRQFVGRTGKSTFRPGDDIDVISGATISAHSLTRAVHRAAVLLDELVLTGGQPQRRASR